MVSSHYGALRTAPKARAERKTLVASKGVAVLGVLLLCGVLASVRQLNAGSSADVVNANKYKELEAPLNNVVEKVYEMSDPEQFGLRWVIVGFNRDKTAVMPLMQGEASDDWEKDFTSFGNALPADQPAVGLYNFDYWLDDDTVETQPLVITWAPKIALKKELARFGYWLGGILYATDMVGRGTTPGLSSYEAGHEDFLKDETDADAKADLTEGDKSSAGEYSEEGTAADTEALEAKLLAASMAHYEYVPLESLDMSYEQFCVEVVATNVDDEEGKGSFPSERCSLDSVFHNCPFGDDEGSPCLNDQCSGATFAKPKEGEAGTVPQGCCDYIMNDFCTIGDNMSNHGCHDVVLSVLKKLCDDPAPDESPELLVTPNEEQLCEEQCQEPCSIFEVENDTYKLCSGCPTDGLMSDDGNVYQCNSKALGFVENRCCGRDPQCGEPAAQNSMMCKTLEYYDCKFIKHNECPAEKADQEEKFNQEIREASGEGCCSQADIGTAKDAVAGWHRNKEYGSDCGGETTDDDIKAAMDFIFDVGKTCDEVQAAYDTARAEAEAEADAAAAAAEAEAEAPAEERR